MIDKDGNIITLKKQIEKSYCFIKENTAQIAIVISIFAAIYKKISDYYFYIVNYGYYKYFGIDNILMLSYNKNNFYQNVGTIAIFFIYWGYSILSVRMLKLKGNYIKKFIFFVIIPLALSVMLVYNETITGQFMATIMAICILIFLQWILIFSLGYCLIMSFDKETLDISKQAGKKKRGWGDSNYMLLGILLISICFAMVFYSGYYNSYRKASEKRTFGVVVINDGKYAVIDANEKKLVLQKCVINDSTLYINKNTYLCANNEVLICYETFDDVKVR